MTKKTEGSKNNKTKKEANLFDKIFKEISDSFVLNHLFKAWGFAKDIIKVKFVKTKMQTTYEREIDGAYFVSGNTIDLIVHLEYQSTNDAKIIYRINEYVSMLRKRHPGKTIKSTVIYIGKEKPTMRTKMHPHEVFTEFELIDIRNLDHSKMLASSDPKTIIHAILADYPTEQAEEVIHKIISNLRKHCKSNNELIQRCYQLQVFSILRNLGETTNKILQNMSVHIDLENTKLFKTTFRPKELEYERMIKEAETAKETERQAKEKAEARLISDKKRTIGKLLKMGALDIHQIAEITDADLRFILQIKNEIEGN